MTRKFFGDQGIAKRIADLNKKALAKEHVVSLDAYRAAAKSPTQKTILVVDDDIIMSNALKRIFEKENYRVLLAKDAMEVSKIMESTKLDLVLLDSELPWVNGYELCSIIKSNPMLKNLPVAFLSEQNSEEDIRKGFDCGCDDYIVKPFEVEYLQKIVNQLLV